VETRQPRKSIRSSIRRPPRSVIGSQPREGSDVLEKEKLSAQLKSMNNSSNVSTMR